MTTAPRSLTRAQKHCPATFPGSSNSLKPGDSLGHLGAQRRRRSARADDVSSRVAGLVELRGAVVLGA